MWFTSGLVSLNLGHRGVDNAEIQLCFGHSNSLQ